MFRQCNCADRLILYPSTFEGLLNYFTRPRSVQCQILRQILFQICRGYLGCFAIGISENVKTEDKGLVLRFL